MRTPVSIKRVHGTAGKLYHARLVGMSRDKAHRSCTTLIRKNIHCVVVPKAAPDIAQGSR